MMITTANHSRFYSGLSLFVFDHIFSVVDGFITQIHSMQTHIKGLPTPLDPHGSFAALTHTALRLKNLNIEFLY